MLLENGLFFIFFLVISKKRCKGSKISDTFQIFIYLISLLFFKGVFVK